MRIMPFHILLSVLCISFTAFGDTFPALSKYSLRNPKVPTLSHLSVPWIQDKVAATLQQFGIKNSPKFNAMFQDIISRERQFVANDKYYTLYHAFDKALVVPQDLYKKLYMYLYAYPRRGSWENFRFLRFFKGAAVSASDYLIDTLEKGGMIFDIDPEVKRLVISTNPSLFGNIGTPEECTFSYFMEPRSHVQVNRSFFESILDIWPLSRSSRDMYVDELMNLTRWFTQTADKQQPSSNILVQLFFPKNMINKVSYISWRGGMPPQPDLIRWINKKMIREKKKGSKQPFVAAAETVRTTLQKEKDNNPLYGKIIDAVRNGQFTTSTFLDTYTRKPQQLINLGKKPGEVFNAIQARVFFNQDVLDPMKGVKMYTYDLISDEVKEEYNQRLTNIVDRIVREVLKQVEEQPFS